MTASITIKRLHSGDDEVHLTGCKDLQQRGKFMADRGWGTFAGEDIVAAIRAADTDMAAAFGQEVYQPDPSDQPWTVNVMKQAPCFVSALPADLRFDANTGEPRFKEGAGPQDRTDRGRGIDEGRWAQANIPEIVEQRGGEPSIKDAANSPEWYAGYVEGVRLQQADEAGYLAVKDEALAQQEAEQAALLAPEFEQSDKPVRLGSEVLIAYPEGDADVGMVTGIEGTGQGATIWVQVAGKEPRAFGVEGLAPFEDEDMDPSALADERAAGLNLPEEPRWSRLPGQSPRWTAQYVDGGRDGYIGIFSPEGKMVDRVQTTWEADAALHNRSRLHEVAVKGTAWACNQCEPEAYAALWGE